MREEGIEASRYARYQTTGGDATSELIIGCHLGNGRQLDCDARYIAA
jgi:hypothetical protein